MILEISVTLTGLLKANILVESWQGIGYPEWGFPHFSKGRRTKSIFNIPWPLPPSSLPSQHSVILSHSMLSNPKSAYIIVKSRNINLSSILRYAQLVNPYNSGLKFSTFLHVACTLVQKITFTLLLTLLASKVYLYSKNYLGMFSILFQIPKEWLTFVNTLWWSNLWSRKNLLLYSMILIFNIWHTFHIILISVAFYVQININQYILKS